MVFGPESDYAAFLQHYFAIAIVDKLLIEESTAQIFNVPGKAVMLNAYNGKTDIASPSLPRTRSPMIIATWISSDALSASASPTPDGEPSNC